MMYVNDIVRHIKTPAYVFSSREFNKRVSKTAEILGKDIKICYSVKANPFLLSVLSNEFSAVEVCSPGELRICMNLNVDPSIVIYSGLNKCLDDITQAIDYGVGILTAESILHLEMINKVTSKRRIKTKVLVRASANSQFGIDRHSLPNVLANHEKYPALEFVGLHFFTGTQKRKSEEILKELDFLERYIEELRNVSGLDLPKIEYGTGLPAYMFYDNKTESVDSAIESELNLLSEVALGLNHLAKHADLTVEMGRFFAASCGHYFTKVMDTKTNDGINYAIVDGGSHQLRYYGQIQGMQVPLMDLIKDGKTINCNIPDAADITDADRWTICGSLCTTADVLARNVYWDGHAMSEGDVISMHQAGAYSLYECMSLFLSRDMPYIYIIDSDNNIKCVRRKIETDAFNIGASYISV